MVALDLDFLAFPPLDFLHTVALAARRQAAAVFGNSRYRDGRARYVGYDTTVARPFRAIWAIRRGCSPAAPLEKSRVGAAGSCFAQTGW